MTAYLHSIYNGGNHYFVFDIWCESEQCFEQIGTWHFDKTLEIAKVYAIAESIGIKKLVLDF